MQVEVTRVRYRDGETIATAVGFDIETGLQVAWVSDATEEVAS